jgi:hypothetical protein
MALASYDWIDNKLEGERQFLLIAGMSGAMAGGMLVGFFPMTVLLMLSMFFARGIWDPSLIMTRRGVAGKTHEEELPETGWYWHRWCDVRGP